MAWSLLTLLRAALSLCAMKGLGIEPKQKTHEGEKMFLCPPATPTHLLTWLRARFSCRSIELSWSLANFNTQEKKAKSCLFKKPCKTCKIIPKTLYYCTNTSILIRSPEWRHNLHSDSVCPWQAGKTEATPVPYCTGMMGNCYTADRCLWMMFNITIPSHSHPWMSRYTPSKELPPAATFSTEIQSSQTVLWV